MVLVVRLSSTWIIQKHRLPILFWKSKATDVDPLVVVEVHVIWDNTKIITQVDSTITPNHLSKHIRSMCVDRCSHSTAPLKGGGKSVVVGRGR